MVYLYFGILSVALVGAGVFRLLRRPSPVCWQAATGLILLAFCVDLGRSLLTASPLDLGRTLAAAVIPITVGLLMCRDAPHEA